MRDLTGAPEVTAMILDAVRAEPLTTAEVSLLLEEPVRDVSKTLYEMKARGAIQRVLVMGEWVWAAPDYVRPVETRVKPMRSQEDEDDERVPRRRPTSEERRALILAALADGPRSVTGLQSSLGLYALAPILQELRDEGLVVKSGKGGTTRWRVADWEAPVLVVVGLRAHTRVETEEPPLPEQAPSWWAVPVMSREKWYDEAKTAGKRLTTSKGKVPYAG